MILFIVFVPIWPISLQDTYVRFGFSTQFLAPNDNRTSMLYIQADTGSGTRVDRGATTQKELEAGMVAQRLPWLHADGCWCW